MATKKTVVTENVVLRAEVDELKARLNQMEAKSTPEPKKDYIGIAKNVAVEYAGKGIQKTGRAVHRIQGFLSKNWNS